MPLGHLKMNTTLFNLITLYRINYLYPFGYRKQKISRLHRTAFLNVKQFFSKQSLSK